MGHVTMVIAKEIPIKVIGKFMIKYVDSFMCGHASNDHKPLIFIYQH